MNMTNISSFTVASVCVAILIVGFLAGSYASQEDAFGAANPGTQATIATSSNPTVGTSPSLVFATSTCQARVITTYANPIMVYFSDFKGQRPSATAGHLQSASTTVAYDASVYGCNAVYIYGYTGNTAITVSEAR